MLKFSKTYTSCRNCNHPFISHCLYSDVKHGVFAQDFVCALEFVPCNSNTVDGKLCNCFDWETSDNLEWLEKKATKQEKKGE